MALHSGQRGNSFTKATHNETLGEKNSCQLKGQRAFEMTPQSDVRLKMLSYREVTACFNAGIVSQDFNNDLSSQYTTDATEPRRNEALQLQVTEYPIFFHLLSPLLSLLVH